MAIIIHSRQLKYHANLPPDFHSLECPEFLYEESDNFKHETGIEKSLNIYKINIEENGKSIYLNCLDKNKKIISKKRFKNFTTESTEVNNNE